MGIHTYVVLCMLYNPTMCIDYEIVPDNFSPVGSVGYCMKGGALFSMEHSQMTIGGIDYVAKGGVRCKGDPPRDTDIAQWVAEQKERAARMLPETR
jgi:hypothetical protein